MLNTCLIIRLLNNSLCPSLQLVDDKRVSIVNTGVDIIVCEFTATLGTQGHNHNILYNISYMCYEYLHIRRCPVISWCQRPYEILAFFMIIYSEWRSKKIYKHINKENCKSLPSYNYLSTGLWMHCYWMSPSF